MDASAHDVYVTARARTLVRLVDNFFSRLQVTQTPAQQLQAPGYTASSQGAHFIQN